MPAQVLAVKGDAATIQLTTPVCTKEDEKIALSRRVDNHWRCVARRTAGGGGRCAWLAAV